MTGLVIGLVIGCAIAVLLVFCFVRSICKDKKVRRSHAHTLSSSSVF